MRRSLSSSVFKASYSLLLLACLSPVSGGNAPQIDYVAWYYKPAQVFKRIAEHFGYPEQTGRKLILRTNPEERQGLYFATHLDGRIDNYPAGTKAVLQVVTTNSPRPATYSFDLPEPAPEYKVIWLGLTGKDEPADKKAPVAWHLAFLAPEGTVLAEKQSFLWSVDEVNASRP